MMQCFNLNIWVLILYLNAQSKILFLNNRLARKQYVFLHVHFDLIRCKLEVFQP